MTGPPTPDEIAFANSVSNPGEPYNRTEQDVEEGVVVRILKRQLNSHFALLFYLSETSKTRD
jgi:hypothetical protein